MSAYIVEDETMDRCVRAILDGGHYDLVIELADKATRVALAAEDDKRTALGRLLFRMNEDAVAFRYDERADRASSKTYSYTHRSAEMVELFKSLDCFTYQCSEGDVPKRPLFRLCEAIQARIACGIVRLSDSYNRAAWG